MTYKMDKADQVTEQKIISKIGSLTRIVLSVLDLSYVEFSTIYTDKKRRSESKDPERGEEH